MKVFYLLLLGLLFSPIIWGQDTILLKASPKAGFYTTGTAVQLQASKPNATIYYTTNGSRPSRKSKRYQGPIMVDSTAVIKAIAVSNTLHSEVLTNSYFIGEDSITLPVVSISIAPYILFDPVKGVFKRGPHAASKFPHKGANYYSRKEYPCHVEIFETNKKRVFHHEIGFKIFGGMSRIFPQKSFSLYASKSRYGNKYIRHQIFPEKKQKKYKRIVLRNSGSDFGETHFRDALITSFGKDIGLEVQAYRPAIVFINGEYWGIYNFREKLTRHYLVENFGYHKDSVNLIEHRKDVQAGSRKTYDAMRTFMRKNSLAIQENFDHVATQMDVENFMEYQILQIYIDNQDAGGNIKFWRPMQEGGKWRWILFDTDFGLGHYGRFGFRNNSLDFHTRPNGPAWPNPPWSTLNLRALLQNKDFQGQFVNRFLDRLNSTFDSTNIIPRIDKMAAVIMPELPRHWNRWKLSPKRWHKEVDRMKEFSRKRPSYMRTFLHQQFPQFGKEITLVIHADSNGVVELNNTINIHTKFEGVYFQKLPVTVKAKPYFGCQFSHWEMDGERINNKELTLRFSDTTHQLKAIFIKGDHPATRQMIINEISFADSLSGDWIEFYNDSNNDLDLKNWKIISTNNNSFEFPNATIKAKDYIVVCKNKERFQQAFPSCKNFIGGLNFGLSSKKEVIMIYDNKANPVDSIGFNFSKDSVHNIQTIVLRDFDLDNNVIDSWKKLKRAGSPASVNPDYIQLKQQKDWERFLNYVKIGGITTAIFVLIVMAYIMVRKQLKIKEE
ncbi:CotH kinase family protein [Aureispira anguillae]|uniref:CotH kinase family protein n=1 Tax=Aureispira anguillae TaxID=2864201 RepID=A0A915YKU2_9BACT|nr:CotH kinase family protein [Aureispira anguillae]BDS14854.1 CotH kinase family protein [Aureispira anguillae]